MDFVFRAARFGARLSIAGLMMCCACSPTPGPDKSVAGAILGAGWGAGAGAVIGNQVGSPGPGTAIGAGFGAVSGVMTGIGFDKAEGTELEQQRQLDALKVQVATNRRALETLQYQLDERTSRINAAAFSEQVFFDPSRASLRLGSAAKLERLAQSMKQNPYVSRVELHGHADDAGTFEKNQQLSEARARTVATFLSQHGISIDQMKLVPHGAEQPLATNDSEPGRQLNRRVEVVMRP